MKIFTLCALLLATACVDVATDATPSAASVDSGGCPAGQQPVFSGHGNELVCADVPTWPPPATGSRAAAADCALADGTYHGAWTSGEDYKLRPAFTYLKELTIAGAHLVEVDIGYTSSSAPPILTPYTYNLDWVDASRANAWMHGDHDTWEFSVWRDCVDGLLHVARTTNLLGPNPGGPQIESWTFTGTAETGDA